MSVILGKKSMRAIQTFVLRLLVDTDHPDAVCGSLQAISGEESLYTFRNEVELSTLVKRLIAERLKANPKEN